MIKTNEYCQIGLALNNPPCFYPSGFIQINPPNYIQFYWEKISKKGKNAEIFNIKDEINV